jgi:hypothetical protein
MREPKNKRKMFFCRKIKKYKSFECKERIDIGNMVVLFEERKTPGNAQRPDI